MDVKFKYLFELTKLEIIDLMKILSDKETMSWIKIGKPWSLDYILDLIKYSKDDYNKKFKYTEYIYICMFINNKLVGFCGLHPMVKNKLNLTGLQIMIIIHPDYRGKGLSKLMIDKLIQFNDIFLNKKIYALVLSNNVQSNRTFKRFISTKQQITVKTKKYNVYTLN